MNRKIVLITFLSFVFLGSTFAQKQRGQRKSNNDTIGVYHNNGSIIIGTLTKESASEISLKIKGGDILLIQKENIKRLKRTSEGFSFTPRGRYNYDRGFYFSLYPLAIFYGNTPPNSNSKAAGEGSQLMLGRHHNARLSYGLKVGISTTDSYDQETNYSYTYTAIPVAVLVNYNLNLNGPRAYLTSKVGQAFIKHRDIYDENIETGIYGTFGIGIAPPTRYFPRFTLEIERTYMQTSGLTDIISISSEGVTTYEPFSKLAKYVTVKFGIAFRQ